MPAKEHKGKCIQTVQSSLIASAIKVSYDLATIKKRRSPQVSKYAN